MRMSQALDIINKSCKPQGFLVSFEWKRGGLLLSDSFPQRSAGDSLIKTEAEAWKLARAFAKQTKGSCVNIYVVDHNFYPVAKYRSKMIANR